MKFETVATRLYTRSGADVQRAEAYDMNTKAHRNEPADPRQAVGDSKILREDAAAHAAATALSRGNICLQAGRFEMAEDLAAMRKALTNYEF